MVQATVATQVLAVLVIVLGGHLCSWLASKWCESFEKRARGGEVLDSLWLNLAKPLSIALPYLGYLVAFMRFLTGTPLSDSDFVFPDS